MNIKKILVVFLLFVTSASIVVAHRRAQHKPEVELANDDEEHSEFEALFNVSGFDLIAKARNTKPMAMINTSTMAYCLSLRL